MSHSRSTTLIVSCSQVCPTTQNEEPADDHEEAAELAAQIFEGAMLERVQERAVPDVQLDLAVGDRADHDHQGAGEDAEPDPVAGRRDQRAQQAQEL